MTNWNDIDNLTIKTRDQGRQQPRILVMSMRGLYSEAFRSAEYEFEDIICNFDHAELMTPTPNVSLPNSVKKKIFNYVGLNLKKSHLLKSHCHDLEINQEYDLFFFVCQHFWDLSCLNSIHKWRDKCKKAVLWIDEIWFKELKDNKTKLCFDLVKEFDYIFTTQSGSVEGISRVTKCPAYSLPYGVDTIKFCPYPQIVKRNIDVYSIGRRSVSIHQDLLELSKSKKLFYVYDTLKGLNMCDYQEHRHLYIQMIQHSRYFIAHKAKFDAHKQTGGQEELGSRFFEGAAAGAVMIGTPPECEAFQRHFDWSDAVIPISGNSPSIRDIIQELDAHPQKAIAIRKNNIINSLLRHDWVYRWEAILEKVGLNITPAMNKRKLYLSNLATLVADSQIDLS
ncbi:glycosyltransferase [Calothrix sp. 336/3]|nr:hypothetical protein IJ00_21585 [Calothrix sp. 336/3]